MANVKYIGMYDIFEQSPYIHMMDDDQSKLMFISADVKIPKCFDGKESTDFYTMSDIINIVNSISAFIDKNTEQSDGN